MTTSKEEEQVPGVTFWFKGSSLGRPGGPNEKYRVDLHLDAAVVDEGLWTAISQKFKDGFRIYTQNDFHGEVIDVMRKKNKELEDQLVVSAKTLASERAERTRLEQELSRLTALGRGLRGGL